MADNFINVLKNLNGTKNKFERRRELGFQPWIFTSLIVMGIRFIEFYREIDSFPLELKNYRIENDSFH